MPDVRLFIEPLPAAEACGDLMVTDDERQRAAEFGSERRRREFLAWRHIVRRELGAATRIEYTAAGRPVIADNPDINIGISHNADFAAVVISPRRCAVDIERLSRDFAPAAPRFLADEERRLSDDPRLAAAVWCAKETMWKYFDEAAGADLRDDLRILGIDFAAGTIVGSLRRGTPVTMRMREHEGCLVVYVG